MRRSMFFVTAIAIIQIAIVVLMKLFTGTSSLEVAAIHAVGYMLFWAIETKK